MYTFLENLIFSKTAHNRTYVQMGLGQTTQNYKIF